MGMADTRSREQKKEDFQKNKQLIIDMVDELIAVNRLEYYNKSWLLGDYRSRYKSVAETLGRIKQHLNNLTR
jgi:hypothetical protein